MGAADRTVQRLHLRAPNAQAAVRALHRLEDALRCASLPDTGERLLLVRRLHLGRLPEGLSSQSLSLLIEQRVVAEGGAWVHGDEERASHCNTVFFANRLQAAQAALRRRAKGLVLSGWYWPLALPGVVVMAAPANFLQQLVACLGAQPGALALLPALAVNALACGHARWLVRHVDAALAHRWVALAGAQRFMPLVAPGGGANRSARGHTGTPVEPLEAWQKQDGPPWPHWLRALLLADARWGAGPAAAQAPRQSAIEVTSPALAHGTPLAGPSVKPDQTTTPAALASAVPGVKRADGGLPDSNGVQVATKGVAPHGGGIDDGAATQAGGLWFLLPLLDRLGFADWQAQHPDQPVLALMLRRALRHLHVPPDDPAWLWVESLPCALEAAPCSWATPRCWCAPAVRLDHQPAMPLSPAGMARRWLIAVRRQLRHEGRLSLADVCRRPAHLSWGRTHIDVVFARDAADLRVRRLGLDIDPGWVVWLGRVVVFVYGAPEGGGT